MNKSTLILNQNKKTYNTIAQSFSNTRNRPWPEMENFVKEYIKDNDQILDIGCGNGRVFDLLKNKNINYLGIDFSDKLINEAKQKNNNPQAEFQVSDILELNIANKFDIVFCLAVLNHLPTKELQTQALTNIYHSLKPGGYLLLTNWNLWNLNQKKSWWRLKLLHPTNWLSSSIFNVITYWGQENLPLYYYAFTLNQLNRLLKKTGFKIIESYYGLDGQPTNWWRGKNLVQVVKK